MGRQRGLRLRASAERSRWQRAPLWRRFVAEIVDGALEIVCHIACRMLAKWAVSPETASSMAERVRAALRELLEPSPPRNETAAAQTPDELREQLAGLIIERLGSGDYWTAEKAVTELAPRLAIRTGPTILTSGQTPGQMLLGVRVVRLDRQLTTARQALVRDFGYTAVIASLDKWPLPQAARASAKLALVTFAVAVRFLDADRRSIGDVLAGTRVIRVA